MLIRNYVIEFEAWIESPFLRIVSANRVNTEEKKTFQLLWMNSRLIATYARVIRLMGRINTAAMNKER